MFSLDGGIAGTKSISNMNVAGTMNNINLNSGNVNSLNNMKTPLLKGPLMSNTKLVWERGQGDKIYEYIWKSKW